MKKIKKVQVRYHRGVVYVMALHISEDVCDHFERVEDILSFDIRFLLVILVLVLIFMWIRFQWNLCMDQFDNFWYCVQHIS